MTTNDPHQHIPIPPPLDWPGYLPDKTVPYCGHCDGAHEPHLCPHIEKIKDRL